MPPPKLTVLIPVHNGENFLAETIRSFLDQSHPAIEVLVVNDGSSDRTKEIAESFGGLVTVINRENAGVSASRNYGLSVAQSDWVALMDHDDLWEHDHLENLAKTIARDPEADVCYSGARRLLRNSKTGKFEPGAQLSFPNEKKVTKALMDRCAFITSSSAVRRESVLATGGFDSHFLNLQDWDLWLRMMHRGCRFLYAPKPTLLYRVHPASRTNNPLRGLRFSKDVVERDILPYLSTIGRLTQGRRVVSRLEGEAAILLRQNGMDGALPLLLRSIARYPFHEFRRYAMAVYIMILDYKRVAR